MKYRILMILMCMGVSVAVASENNSPELNNDESAQRDFAEIEKLLAEINAVKQQTEKVERRTQEQRDTYERERRESAARYAAELAADEAARVARSAHIDALIAAARLDDQQFYNQQAANALLNQGNAVRAGDRDEDEEMIALEGRMINRLIWQLKVLAVGVPAAVISGSVAASYAVKQNAVLKKMRALSNDKNVVRVLGDIKKNNPRISRRVFVDAIVSRYGIAVEKGLALALLFNKYRSFKRGLIASGSILGASAVATAALCI